MCEVTQDGYKMTDGEFVRFADEIQNISPKHIEEMNRSNPTSWDSFLVHKQISCLEKKILKALNNGGIRKIVTEEIKILSKTKYANFFSKARDISVILTMITTIIVLIKNFL
jgi:hypothetical protein